MMNLLRFSIYLLILTNFLIQVQAHGKSNIRLICYDHHGNQLILLQDDQASDVDFKIMLNAPKVSLYGPLKPNAIHYLVSENILKSANYDQFILPIRYNLKEKRYVNKFNNFEYFLQIRDNSVDFVFLKNSESIFWNYNLCQNPRKFTASF